jgi:peptidoglycan/xylan/chitin deacetylase (PgdA/CDA1 family)
LRPFVSEYLLQNGFNPQYPHNKKFGLCVSHDIDVLYKKDLSLKGSLKPKQIYDDYSITNTLKIGNKYNLKSSFYFLALENGELDYNYSLGAITDAFEEIKDNNCEIGLHGGFNAYMDLKKIKQEKSLLEAAIKQEVKGYRGHFLKFNTPLTWKILDELNFSYDTTFGYANHVGFRNGMCHPFRPYCKDQGKYLDILEIPLVIMDATLGKYMGLTKIEQLKQCKDLIDIVERNKGVLSLLWHNDNMNGENGEMYESILKYAYEKNAWMATGEEMSDYWKENYDELQIVALEKLRKYKDED